MDLEKLTLPLDVSGKAFNAGVAGAIAGVTALVGAMGVAVKATFDWANDLDSLGDVMGGTNEELAALNFIARKSGVSVDTLAKGTVILEKGLVDAKGKLDTTGKALKNWGINVFDANGKLKDQTMLMGDIAKKYGEFGTQQEKVNFLTEVFGKSGAGLVDFFDTLAQEGGIDKVTQKVKDFGLAIDPGRYEQFNRNLEEMKLMGLGLAVGFTEKLMPVFEAVSEWVFTKGIPALKSFGGQIDKAFKSGGLLGVADFLLDEFDKIDWGEVGKTVTDGINSIDWAQAGMDFAELAKHVGTSIGEAFGEVDWLGLGNSLASGLNNFVAGMFGTDEAGMQTVIQTKLAETQQALTDWAHGAPSSLDALDAGIMARVNSAMQSLWTAITTKLAEARTSFVNWAAGVVATVATWGANIVASVNSTLVAFTVNITNRLTEIAKTFFNAGGKWINQAVAGFNDHKVALLNAISAIVGEINAILKKIITSFTLNIKLPSFLGGGGNNPPTNSVGGQSGGLSPDERNQNASGGTFKIPGAFGNEGFNLGALGTASGGEVIRITPRGQSENQLQPVVITNWNGFDYIRLATEIVKAQGNA